MALFHVHYFSGCLGMQVSADVILPERRALLGSELLGSERGKHPVLYLLHGMSGDHASWGRQTAIERYVEGLGLAVVMPDAHQSFYANMAHGSRYFGATADELPEVMRGFFPLSGAREDNFIAGLSMGGVGSLKIGLARPGRFAAIGCLSAPLPMFVMKHRPDDDQAWKDYRYRLFGDRDLAGTEEDAAHSARTILAKGLPAPRIYHAWGSEDFVLEDARETRDFFLSFQGNPFGYTWEEHPGAHTWEFWDEHIRRFLAFLALQPPQDAQG